jgi:hypothetical protein
MTSVHRPLHTPARWPRRRRKQVEIFFASAVAIGHRLSSSLPPRLFSSAAAIAATIAAAITAAICCYHRRERYFISTTQWCVRHSPSTRRLARPLREANAAAARTHGRGNTLGQHPSRREHAVVLVGMLCAPNGTKHQQKHKYTAHSS